MIKKTATVKNGQGIHCRPSAVIIKYMQEFAGSATVATENGVASLQSIMGLLSLCLEKGTALHITVEGENEEEVCNRLVELFETEFDFPPREEA